MLLLGGAAGAPVMLDALRDLIAPGTRLSLAVSYLQVSGWDQLRSLLPPGAAAGMRVLCDDRMGITDPAAVTQMMAAGVAVRAYGGTATYHPKIYLAAPANDGVARALVGSANLSEPALRHSVEAGLVIEDGDGALGAWFDGLFAAGRVMDDARLEAMRRARLARLKGRLTVRAAVAAELQGAPTGDDELVDEIFAGIGSYVAPLSFDQGKNNVRSLETAIEILRQDPASWVGYNRLEMRYSGLASGQVPTSLGVALLGAPNLADAVRLWAKWLKTTPPDALPKRRYDNLAVAQRAFAGFWRMQPDVRNFFLSRSIQQNAADRPVLQAIELLANAGPVGETLSLAEVEALAPLLTDPAVFPSGVAKSVRTYLRNKAGSNWGSTERRMLLEDWRSA